MTFPPGLRLLVLNRQVALTRVIGGVLGLLSVALVFAPAADNDIARQRKFFLQTKSRHAFEYPVLVKPRCPGSQCGQQKADRPFVFASAWFGGAKSQKATTGKGLNPTANIEDQQGCDVKFGRLKGAIISIIHSIGEQSFN